MSESFTADIRGSDLAVASGLAAAVFAASLLALAYARLEHRADVPSIDPGIGVPIAVRPVADLPIGHAGAAADSGQVVVPKRWRRRAKTPKKPPTPTVPELPELPWSEPEPEPTVEPAPTDAPITRPQPPTPADPSATPDETTPVDPEPPLPDVDAEDTAEQAAEPSDTADTPEQDTSATQDPPAGESEGESAGAGQGEQQGDGQGQAEGESEGAGGGGGTDPLLERAIAFYRARLVAWFAERFHVSGSGLSRSELTKYGVRVHIEVGDDLRIIDYSILSSDHPAFEAAARATLDKLRGTKLPAPPENFPGAVQRQLTVTFTCTEDSCD